MIWCELTPRDDMIPNWYLKLAADGRAFPLTPFRPRVALATMRANHAFPGFQRRFHKGSIQRGRCWCWLDVHWRFDMVQPAHHHKVNDSPAPDAQSRWYICIPAILVPVGLFQRRNVVGL